MDVNVTGSNGLEISAGNAKVAATGNIVIQFLLTILIVTATFYSIFTNNQQTATIQAEHRAMATAMEGLTRINENVFLATILTTDQKKDLPPCLKEKADDIIQKRKEALK